MLVQAAAELVDVLENEAEEACVEFTLEDRIAELETEDEEAKAELELEDDIPELEVEVEETWLELADDDEALKLEAEEVTATEAEEDDTGVKLEIEDEAVEDALAALDTSVEGPLEDATEELLLDATKLLEDAEDCAEVLVEELAKELAA